MQAITQAMAARVVMAKPHKETAKLVERVALELQSCVGLLQFHRLIRNVVKL
jgi:hypothetical protein